MSFEMRNLTSFPMVRLYYDLKLEVLEQMEPIDAIELVKVNEGFRSILLRTPWRVFGHHVHQIEREGLRSQMDKAPIRLNPLRQGLNRIPLPLIKRIHSCDVLNIYLWDVKLVRILSQLNSVKRLHLGMQGNECLLTIFKNFHSVIEESASIDYTDADFFKGNQVIIEPFKNFIVNQINVCKKVNFDCECAAGLHFYHDAFAKTSIKFLRVSTWNHFEEIAQSIVDKGIPSKNLKAAFWVGDSLDGGIHDRPLLEQMKVRVVDFLSQYPGLKRFDGENEQEVVMKRATKLLKKHFDSSPDLTESLFFRQNNDSNRDCVYILYLSKAFNRNPRFFAFYVQPQSQMMVY